MQVASQKGGAVLKTATGQEVELRKYDEETNELYAQVTSLTSALKKAKKAKDTSEMETLCEDLKSACTAFAKKMGYSGLSWTVTYKNEIEVDPR